MTDFRSLLERMANELDYLCQLLRDDRREIHALAAEARAALAQPAADGEVAELVTALDQLASAAEMYGPAGGADGRALNDAVASAHAVLARWGSAQPQPPADGEVAELVQWLRSQDGGLGKRAIHSRIADLLERKHQPVPVSERLPEAADCTGDGEVWVEEIGCEYPLGDAGDYDWEPHKWILRPIGRFDAKKRLRWLPAHALPLPSEEEAP